jgi:hypothetical protein
VYAVVAAGTRVPRGLRLVPAGRIAAVVEPGRARAVNRRNVLAYDHMVRELADRVAAILPARFNTVVADEGEIAAALAARRPHLLAALRHVRGRVQVTVRIPAGRAAAPDKARRAGVVRPTGTEYLRSRRIPEIDPVRAAVRKIVRDERVERHTSLASIHHLVPAASVDAYWRAVVGAADAAGLRLVITGPFPPYAFAEIW